MAEHCEWCGVSIGVWRDPEGELRTVEAVAPDGTVGSCGLCGLPSVWREGVPRRISFGEIRALRPEVARGLLAAADALRDAAA